MHRSSSCDAKNPGSCENPSCPQLTVPVPAPSGEKAWGPVESDGVYAGCQSGFMAGEGQGAPCRSDWWELEKVFEMVESGMGGSGCPHTKLMTVSAFTWVDLLDREVGAS